MPPSTSLLPKPVRLRESTTRPHHQPPQQSSNGATQQPAPPDSQQPAPVEDGAVATADLSGVCVACASFGRRFPLVLPRPLRLTPTIEKMIELSQKERERTDETRQAVHTVEQVRRQASCCERMSERICRLNGGFSSDAAALMSPLAVLPSCQSLTHLYAGTRQTQSSEASLALRVRQLKAGIARLVQENASMREVWEEETENMEEWSTSAVKQAEEEVSQALHAKAAARQYAMADDLQHEREMNSLKAEIAQLTQSVGRGFNTSSVYGEYGRKAKEWGMRARMESFVADGVRIINMLEQDALPADVDARAITQEQLEQLLAKKYQEGLVSLQLQAAQASNQVKRMEEVSRNS